MKNAILSLSLLSLVQVPPPTQAASPKQQAIASAASLDSAVHELSMALWELSETALEEHRSAEMLASVLEREGFRVARGVSQMPTAFVATWGSGRPIVGILAEYDALPGVGNAAVPEKAGRENGVTSGHGCGHNLFGPASVAGAIAAKRTLESLDAPGTVRLYGTPAEEIGVGKVYMARDGLFDDLDVALDWHPGTETETSNQTGLALNNFFVEFFGQAAHGARDPWNGRSALDAVELMNFGVNLMREHVEPSARIHYVIPSGGDAPNVVPEYAKVWYYVRDAKHVDMQRHYDRILKIAEGAAIATETTHKATLVTGLHECVMIRPLQEAIQRNLEIVGGPEYEPEEQDFARSLQRSLGVEEKGYVGTVEKLAEGVEPNTGGSTDVCEVSYIVPEGGFRVTTAAAGVPWHSWATTACHGTSAGVKGAQVAARVLAATAVELLTDPQLLGEVQQTFRSLTGGARYQSPIPADQAPPKPD